MSSIQDDLAKCLAGVTKEYTKQRKAEERNSRAFANRRYMYSDRVNFTDVARRIFPAAYRLASGEGQYPASKRQVYYSAREEFRKATGREITQQRCNMLLLQYMNTHPSITSSWRVTADPRGTLLIPNTHKETRIPCGTLDIDRHLESMHDDEPLDQMLSVPWQWPSIAAGQRFRAVLYIEKEGFEPLLRQTRIAERFEIAVLSCKGQSVAAARKYVDQVCHINGGVPLFVVHDFDVFGFFIAARLTSVSQGAWDDDRVAYHFRNDINVTDFGLRLEDARKYGLADEACKRPKYIDRDLGCTDEERSFLYSGRRIELNAFTAPQFIEWLESKLRAAGLDDRERMIPPDDVLEKAYRRSIMTVRVNKAVEDIHAELVREASDAPLPKQLRNQLRKHMSGSNEPWDIALHRVAAARLGVKLPDKDGSQSKGDGTETLALLKRLGITPDTAKRAQELARFSEVEFSKAVAELKAKGEELTSDDIAKQLRRNRRKQSRKPRG
jgi:hypothetical protein